MTTSLLAGTEVVLLGRKVRLYNPRRSCRKRTQMHPLHPRVEVYPFESHANSHALLGTGFSYRPKLMILSDHARPMLTRSPTSIRPRTRRRSTRCRSTCSAARRSASTSPTSRPAPGSRSPSSMRACQGRARAPRRGHRPPLHGPLRADSRHARVPDRVSRPRARVGALADRAGHQGLRQPGDERGRPGPLGVPGAPGLPRTPRDAHGERRAPRRRRGEAIHAVRLPAQDRPRHRLADPARRRGPRRNDACPGTRSWARAHPSCFSTAARATPKVTGRHRYRCSPSISASRSPHPVPGLR